MFAVRGHPNLFLKERPEMKSVGFKGGAMAE
jgi:hypothetical protein